MGGLARDGSQDVQNANLRGGLFSDDDPGSSNRRCASCTTCRIGTECYVPFGPLGINQHDEARRDAQDGVIFDVIAFAYGRAARARVMWCKIAPRAFAVSQTPVSRGGSA